MPIDLNDGGPDEWLRAGEYEAVVLSWKEITARTGTRGYEYTFQAESGKAKGVWWHTKHDGTPVMRNLLRDFAEAAGLDKEQVENFEPHYLQGRTVGISVVRDGDTKYHKVDGVFSAKEVGAITQKAEAETTSNGGYDNDADVPF